MVRNIRHFFQRGEVTEQELRTLHGVVTELALGRRQRWPPAKKISRPAGHEDALFQFGVIPCGCYDLIVLVHTKTLITDRVTAAVSTCSVILSFLIGARGGHIFFQCLAQLEDVHDGLADVRYCLVRYIGVLQQSVVVLSLEFIFAMNFLPT